MGERRRAAAGPRRFLSTTWRRGWLGPRRHPPGVRARQGPRPARPFVGRAGAVRGGRGARGRLSSPPPPRWCVLPAPAPALPAVCFTAAPPGKYAAVGMQAVGLSLFSSWGNLWMLPGSAGGVPGKSRYVCSQRVKGRLQAAPQGEEAEVVLGASPE